MTPQGAGDDSGRSKLANAFARWRLNTCDATVDELSGSLSTDSRRGNLATAGGESGFDADGFPRAPRHVQSLAEMWENASEGQDRQLHDIVLMKMRADRPLPCELCEAYEREMVERIDRRQEEKNIPILLLPIC